MYLIKVQIQSLYLLMTLSPIGYNIYIYLLYLNSITLINKVSRIKTFNHLTLIQFSIKNILKYEKKFIFQIKHTGGKIKINVKTINSVHIYCSILSEHSTNNTNIL